MEELWYFIGSLVAGIIIVGIGAILLCLIVLVVVWLFNKIKKQLKK